ncbi:MAG: hypothetical protein H6835_11515 [Planctomycetes bacterium]|nr:hypothetical protein [Planctomycetota bacterium]
MRPLADRFFSAALPVLCALAAAAPVLGQQDQAALLAREQQLAAKAVPGLHALADALVAEKQYGQAAALRREIWMDYDENDARSRQTTGFVQVGSLWRKDDKAAVLERDLKGNKSKLKKIEREQDKLFAELLQEHRALAQGFTQAGVGDRAAKHWRRVLRFAPGDAEAAQALALREFEGFTGTELELRMLRRSRAIRGAVDWLNRQQFPVQDIGDRRQPLLEAAGIAHSGVQSEHYQVWGPMSHDDLATLAQDCERSLLLAHTLFGTSLGEPFHPRRLRNLVFTADQEQYTAALTVCRGQFDQSRFEFFRDVVDQCFVSHGGEDLRLHKLVEGMPVARDQAVRGVMQDASGVKAEGLWEGLGHAACGLLFGRTLCFLLEQQEQRTAASWEQKLLEPDLEVWMQIAQESAWAKSDTRSSELVLLSAARFTTEQRVKAWAIAHYLLHWRPNYLLELDQSQNASIHTPPDVEAEFLRRTGYELPRIDEEWRSFWARSDALRQAMTKDPLPNEGAKNRKAIERGRDVVDAVCAARAAAGQGPVGWFVDEQNPDFATVRAYEVALQKAEREAERAEKAKKAGKKADPVEMPAPPAAIGRTVLWSRSEHAADAVREWMADPAQRDALLHPGRDLCGVAGDGGAFLVSVALPAEPAESGEPLAWPRDGQGAVPCGVRVGDLGARAQAALAAAGKQADDRVGVPLTLHFARAVKLPLLQIVQCEAFDGNLRVDGVTVVYALDAAGDGAPPDTCVGVVAFVPLQPLGAGHEVEVRWQVPGVMLGKDRSFPTLRFTTG